MSKRGAKNLVSEKALRVVRLDLIKFDPSYQRDVVPKHKRIVADFEPDALGIPLVAERDDGSLWCVDGRQRITALIKMGKTTVRAEVFRSDGAEHEAKIFRLVNLNRTKLRSGEIFQALLTAGDETAHMVAEVARKNGFLISKGGSGAGSRTLPETAAKHLACVNTCMKIAHTTNGEEALEFVLSTLSRVWAVDPYRTRTEVVEGLWRWYNRREGVVDQDRLVERLAATAPQKIIYSASLGVGDRASNVADVIERLYNRRTPRGLSPPPARDTKDAD